MKHAFTLSLMLIALWVFIGKAQDKGMWLPIALYWAVLTLKNLYDWIDLRRKDLSKE